jgi:hypothetical protein
VQSRDRAGIREPHKRLKEDDSRWLPGKGNFAVTKTIFIKIHLSTIAGVWWLELLFINFIKEITVLNKINNEMVLVLNIYPHHYTTTKGNDKMINIIRCDCSITAVFLFFWCDARKTAAATKMIENGTDSHHGIALSFPNHLELDQTPPVLGQPYPWVPGSPKKLQLWLIFFPNHRARRHGASESEVLTLVSVYKRRSGVTKKNVRGWWFKSS